LAKIKKVISRARDFNNHHATMRVK